MMPQAHLRDLDCLKIRSGRHARCQLDLSDLSDSIGMFGIIGRLFPGMFWISARGRFATITFSPVAVFHPPKSRPLQELNTLLKDLDLDRSRTRQIAIELERLQSTRFNANLPALTIVYARCADMLPRQQPNRVPNQSERSPIGENDHVEQPIARVSSFKYLKPQRVARDVPCQELPSALENALTIDMHPNHRRTIIPQCPQHRTKIAEVGQVSAPRGRHATHDLRIETDTRDKQKPLMVAERHIQRFDTTGPYHIQEQLLVRDQTEIFRQHILRPTWNDQNRWFSVVSPRTGIWPDPSRRQAGRRLANGTIATNDHQRMGSRRRFIGCALSRKRSRIVAPARRESPYRLELAFQTFDERGGKSPRPSTAADRVDDDVQPTYCAH